MRGPNLPFRPRGDDSRRSIEDVAVQLARTRRRSNLYVAQEALYRTAAWGLLGFSLVVLLAFRLSQGAYAAAVWTTVIALVSAVVHGTMRAWGRWLTRRRAAIDVDRLAALEGRLATLVALRERPPVSRLWDFLVRDNLARLPGWEPARLVPRAVPRKSAALCLLAALAAAGVLWIATLRPAEGDALPMPGGSGKSDAPLAAPAAEDVAGGGMAGLSSLIASLPERLREAILRRATKAPPGARPPRGAKVLARLPGGAGGSLRRTERDQGSSELPSPGSPADAPQGQSEQPGSRRARNGAGVDSLPPLKGDGVEMLAPAGGRARSHEQTPGAKGSGGKSPGGAGGAGAGAGGDATRLFGDREGRREADGSFALDLDAELRERGRGEEGDDPGRLRPEGALSAEQRLDDAVRRAQVPPDYEAIVRRIFGRPEEAGVQ